MIRVLLVDDHDLVRSGLELLLDREDDITVVGGAASGEEGVRLALELRPDVIIMDITLPGLDGIAATKLILESWPEASVMALTMLEEEAFLVAFLEAGGTGYVRKSAADRDLVGGLREVIAGEMVIPVAGVRAIVDFHRPNGSSVPPPGILSDREREVLELTARGFTSREIGEVLFISSRTVETYRGRIMEKLGLRRRSELVEYAIEQGLLGR